MPNSLENLVNEFWCTKGDMTKNLFDIEKLGNLKLPLKYKHFIVDFFIDSTNNVNFYLENSKIQFYLPLQMSIVEADSLSKLSILPFAEDECCNKVCFDYRDKTTENPPIVICHSGDSKVEEIHIIANDFEQLISTLYIQ